LPKKKTEESYIANYPVRLGKARNCMKKVNLRKEAKGRPCTICLFGMCNQNPETTVLCHLPGPGVSIKADDRHAAIGCSACHDIVDGRALSFHETSDEIKLNFYQAVICTQKIWIKEGLM